MSPASQIAVVGIGGIFPQAPTLERYWQNIRDGVNAAREVPAGRWLLDPADAFDAVTGAADKVYSRRGCFIEDFAFDPAGLDLDPEWCAALDPMVHFLLHAGREAFNDAVTAPLDRERVGVIVGNIALPTNAVSAIALETLGRSFAERLGADPVAAPTDATAAVNRYVTGLPAGILAQALGLGGGTSTLDAACASSLYAVKLAIDELTSGRRDAMLAGGMSGADCLYTQMGFSQLRALSATGICAPFDQAADGLVVGEGAGVVVLKRLADALKHGDQIYGVITGVGLSNDIEGNLLAPDSEGQLRAMRQAYDRAGWQPWDVDIIECHATGTPLGDAVEFNSLRQLWQGAPANTPGCVIGGVKSNVGHLLTGAGAAGLIKVLLALKHGTLPPTANFSKANSKLALSETPFEVLTASRPWTERDRKTPRRAAVSAFGFGGINAHVLVEEWREAAPSTGRSGRRKSTPAAPVPVAIVGMQAQVGTAASLAQLKAQLLGDSAPAADRNRSWWGIDESRWLREQGRTVPAGHYIDKIDIPVGRFRIPPREIEEMLPQQLLMLQVAADALADAGYTHADGLQTGLFIGLGLDLSTTNFHFRWSLLEQARKWAAAQPETIDPADLAAWTEALRDSAGPALSPGRTLGALGGIVASRIAREFKIGGPSHTVSSEETSGMHALAFAVRALQNGELRQALVGAVDLCGDIRSLLCTDADRPFSRTGSSMPFDPQSPGSVPADGAVAFVLKRLDNALADNDAIYAVIDGVGNANGGGCQAMVPTAEAYSRSLREALAEAGQQPADIGLYELHGSGFTHEDRMESAAILDVTDDPSLAVSSAKAVIGHTGAAGGLLSVCNVVFALQDAVLPSRLPLTAAGFAAAPAPWSATNRRALIAAFSIDGNCTHAVLRAAPAGGQSPRVAPAPAGPGQKLIHVYTDGPAFVMPPPPHPKKVVILPAAAAWSDTAASVSRPTPPPAAVPNAMPAFTAQSPAATAVMAATSPLVEAHADFLRFSEQTTQALLQNLALQMRIIEELAGGTPLPSVTAAPAAVPAWSPAGPPATPPKALNREQCMTFAIGRIGDVLGPDFAAIDAYPTRVRLPDEPLMLVDRITEIDAVPLSMTNGRLVTEHDVLHDGWYLDNGRIPTCIAVEAGQADLFLSGYLGIDFISKGDAVYRLLDATVTFHGPLPKPGKVIRYDIRIDKFFEQGGMWFFHFNFIGTVDGQPLLTMTNGCAGFFTEAALAAGQGIRQSRLDRQPMTGVRPADWQDLVPMAVESYSDAQIDALRAGDLTTCFGPRFANLPIRKPSTLPSGRMTLLNRVLQLDPTGGRYGIGFVSAQADIHPTDWFLVCHFIDDRVMPGTLMYECCLHALRVYLLRLGWVAETGSCVYEPVAGIKSQLKCRGQVLESTKHARYDVTIKEIGFNPAPYAIVDALMYADDKPIVEITSMSVQLTGLTRAGLEQQWQRADTGRGTPAAPVAKKVLFDYDSILAFSNGNPSDAFGEPYRIFDHDRKIARLPRPPYQFLDRITRIDNCWPFVLAAGGSIDAEYDVPPNEWYFINDQPMPYAVLLEIALQPCGWLAAYLGSALTSETDLCFRNLGGDGVQHRQVTRDTGTLTTAITITSVSNSAGMIIQHFEMAVTCPAGPVFTGKTYFGFFTKAALKHQVGIQGVTTWQPTAEQLAAARPVPCPPTYQHRDEMLRMVEQVTCYLPDGGPAGLGFMRATKQVNPADWFFQAHFYQDPVWPGSLGLESLLQLLQIYALDRWNLPGATVQAMADGARHEWVYRGQIIPTDALVTVDAIITAVDDASHTLIADGSLTVDGRLIYQMKKFSIKLTT